ncbi:hypothetical protein MKW98_012815 [Papaver atlanticum]|uniref:Uncharacterized protein n=1 Tax=Papaver atlanticum TaxID=357466 RepID=A0AAD4SL19_9MAGN|nr:hypothetical protein MKW98_012815 [Papaver atlanticum]
MRLLAEIIHILDNTIATANRYYVSSTEDLKYLTSMYLCGPYVAECSPSFFRKYVAGAVVLLYFVVWRGCKTSFC